MWRLLGCLLGFDTGIDPVAPYDSGCEGFQQPTMVLRIRYPYPHEMLSEGGVNAGMLGGFMDGRATMLAVLTEPIR